MVIGKKKILALTLTGHWHIDEDFAMSSLSRHVETIELLKSGVLQLSDIQAGAPSSTTGTVGIINIEGTMFLEDTYCEQGALSIANEIQAMYDNPEISRVVLHTNSGGGDSQAGYVIRDKVKERNKPVDAYVLNAGSAAYNAISGVDNIYLANESSRAGSIGSFFSINKNAATEYSKAMEEVYASQSVDKNGAIRAYLKGDKTLLQKEATASAQTFIDSVKGLRPNINESVFTGGMYSGQDAIDLGLADGYIGSLDNLIKQSSAPQHSKFSKEMNFSVITKLLNNIFGWTLSDSATEAELTAKLQSQVPVATAVNDAVTTQLGVMNDAIASLKAQVAGFTAQVSTLQSTVTTLTDRNAALVQSEAAVVAQKDALAQELLDLKASHAAAGKTNTTLAVVQEAVDANITLFKIGNEGKY